VLPANAGRMPAAPLAAMARVVRIRECGLVAGDGTHADTLIDVVAARLDDALLQAPGLGTRVLEVEVGVVDAVAEQVAEDDRKLLRRQIIGIEQALLGGTVAISHGSV